MKIRFDIPFYPSLNINRKPNRRGTWNKGTGQAKVAIEDLQMSCKIACINANCLNKWEARKIYVAIMVHMPPKYRGDPSNFEKPIVDAIEPILGVNDRHYAVSVDFRRVDEGDKPSFGITVFQEEVST